MTVKIAFFAAARDITGCDFLDLSVDDAATVATVKQDLSDRYPELTELMNRSTWSVDHEYVGNEKELYDGAEIGMIPPVSGG